MKKVKLKDAKTCQVPKHFDVTVLSLQGELRGKKETKAQKLWMGLAHFLPQGGAKYDESLLEKIYFVLEGEVTVKTKTEEIVLEPWDSIYIGPNEGREIINNTDKPASMLVVINYPD